jgi:FtsH-binding integral membrane protein
MKACAPVFVGLTAYDTQRIKEMYLESDTAEVADKKAVLGALALYLDFMNLFMMLLQFVRSEPGELTQKPVRD